MKLKRRIVTTEVLDWDVCCNEMHDAKASGIELLVLLTPRNVNDYNNSPLKNLVQQFYFIYCPWCGEKIDYDIPTKGGN